MLYDITMKFNLAESWEEFTAHKIITVETVLYGFDFAEYFQMFPCYYLIDL